MNKIVIAAILLPVIAGTVLTVNAPVMPKTSLQLIAAGDDCPLPPIPPVKPVKAPGSGSGTKRG